MMIMENYEKQPVFSATTYPRFKSYLKLGMHLIQVCQEN